MNKFRGLGTVRSITPQPHTQPKARVLVVDDDLDTVHSLALLLKGYGHEVEFAINGLAAIDAARRFRPDVILMDINLPDIKGHRLARQLKFEPGLEQVRVIAVSGKADDETKAQALEAGCAEFHVKPIEAESLERLLA